jgi:hypothetical protein
MITIIIVAALAIVPTEGPVCSCILLRWLLMINQPSLSFLLAKNKTLGFIVSLYCLSMVKIKCFVLFLVVVGIELRAWHLLGKCFEMFYISGPFVFSLCLR